MKTIVSDRTGKVVAAGPGDGLGIGVSPLSCGGWVALGELPGYQSPRSRAETAGGRSS